MRTYLTISVGRSAREATPVLASSNQEVVAAALDAVMNQVVRRDPPSYPRSESTERPTSAKR